MTAARPGVATARPVTPTKVVRLMLAFFGDAEIPAVEAVDAQQVPPAYRTLLAHAGHMTERLEQHHGAPVEVRPHSIRREGDIYGRRIDLVIDGRAAPVMTAVMIFNLGLVSAAVRQEILRADTPLGHVLIRHRILRRVAVDALLRFDADDPLVARFGRTQAAPAYGRLATIDCDGRPAVDLLEIVAP
jgi:chorismate-pyruvate lyase